MIANEVSSGKVYDWVFWQDEAGLWRGMTTDGEIRLGVCDTYSQIVRVAAIALTYLGQMDEADVLECYLSPAKMREAA